MREAVAILLLIPFALVGTFVGGFIFGWVYVIAANVASFDGAMFVGMHGALAASVYTVPASLLVFPLAYYVLPPRGHSALNWTLHCAALGVGLGVAGVFASYWLRPDPRWFSLAAVTGALFGSAITGALFGSAMHKLTSAARLSAGSRRDAIALILTGIALLWIPLLLQFAGDVIPVTGWGRSLVVFVPFLLMVAAMLYATRGRPRTTSTWGGTLAVVMTVVLGVIPLLAVLRRLAGEPDTGGIMRVPVEWVSAFAVLFLGALANVEPSLRAWHHVFFWSMAVLAWTFWVVPEPWRYFAANAGCCLVMIVVGCWVLLRQSRRQVGVAA